MKQERYKILIVTTTRAEWGILSPLARALASRSDVELTVAAGNMHTSSLYGYTLDEIRADGFDDIELLAAPEVDGTAQSRTKVAAAVAEGVAAVIERRKPDTVVILGDRYEMLGAATAALIADVPIVHLHGGEVTLGAIDNKVRNALTKMASLHLAATRQSTERIRQWGEDPGAIVHTGAIGVENVLTLPVMQFDELRRSLDGFDIAPTRTMLVTYHPVTHDNSGLTTEAQIDAILGALDQVAECNAIITYPNNDTGSEVIIEKIEDYARRNPDRIKVVKSLGRLRYHSALRHVCAVVGNTSSGLLEVPSSPAATIDIGPRQQGRERAASVVHIEADPARIAEAIRNAMNAPRKPANPQDNPYYRPGAVKTAADAIMAFLTSLKKETPHLDIP